MNKQIFRIEILFYRFLLFIRGYKRIILYIKDIIYYIKECNC